MRERCHAVAVGRRIAADDREFMRFVPMQLFSKEHRYNTFVGLLFGLGSLLAIWTTSIWLPTILSLMVQKNGVTGAAAVPFVSHGIMIWSFGGIFGYICFGFIADLIGRRVDGHASTAPARSPPALCSIWLCRAYQPGIRWFCRSSASSSSASFSGFAIYLPELFPTQVRATAVGFCTGSARIITSFGPLVAGMMVGAFGGSFNR